MTVYEVAKARSEGVWCQCLCCRTEDKPSPNPYHMGMVARGEFKAKDVTYEFWGCTWASVICPVCHRGVCVNCFHSEEELHFFSWVNEPMCAECAGSRHPMFGQGVRTWH